MSSILEHLFPTVGSESEDQDSSDKEIPEDSSASPDLQGSRRSARKRKKTGGYFPPKRVYKKTKEAEKDDMGVGHTPKKSNADPAPLGEPPKGQTTQVDETVRGEQTKGPSPLAPATLVLLQQATQQSTSQGGHTLDSIAGMIAGLV